MVTRDDEVMVSRIAHVKWLEYSKETKGKKAVLSTEGCVFVCVLDTRPPRPGKRSV